MTESVVYKLRGYCIYENIAGDSNTSKQLELLLVFL